MMPTSTDVQLYIIMADDVPDDHLFFKNAIKACDLNHIVSSVYTGGQLLDILFSKNVYRTEADRHPDLIILSLTLPVKSGWDALREISRHECLKSVRIVALVDKMTENERETAKELGINVFLDKPLSDLDWQTLALDTCHTANSHILRDPSNDTD
jgi:CheY-like chemotaxis protein